MSTFISSQTEFKAKAKQLHQLINLNTYPSDIKYQDVLNILIGENEKRNIEIIDSIFKHLQNKQLSTLSLGQVQQLLALKSTDSNYQSFKAKHFEKPLDARKFLNIPFLIYPSKQVEGIVNHPFPKELERLPVLLPWREIWESLNVSTMERPFLVPMLPAQCFQGLNLKTKQYQSWSKNSSNAQLNGKIGVLIYYKNKVVGCISWGWWGISKNTNGLDFTLNLIDRNKLISLSFDIRPNHELPTFGPYINTYNFNSNETKEKFELDIDTIKSYEYIHEEKDFKR